MLTFEYLMNESNDCYDMCKKYSAELKNIKAGSNTNMGLTPDSVKQMKEYKEAKQMYNFYFNKGRTVMAVLNKNYKKELAELRPNKFN